MERERGRYPERFLFGTDEVAPADFDGYTKVYRQYEPLLRLRSPNARQLLLRGGNYERLRDEARVRVRAWENANPR